MSSVLLKVSKTRSSRTTVYGTQRKVVSEKRQRGFARACDQPSDLSRSFPPTLRALTPLLPRPHPHLKSIFQHHTSRQHLHFTRRSPHQRRACTVPDTMSYLNDLVSQHESLLSICKHLSADIIHLAATCKENRASTSETKPTYALLQRHAHCDGKGIAAQAHLFKLHGEDPSKPHWRCLDEECPHDNRKPCDDSQVCNVCLPYVKVWVMLD